MLGRKLLRFAFSVFVLLVVPTVGHAQWPPDGRALCTATLGQSSPRIVEDGAGGAIVVWADYRKGTYEGFDIYAQHVLSTGVVDPAWPVDGRVLCNSGHGDDYPAIVSDGAGGAIVTWADSRNGTIYYDYSIYAQHVLGTGVVDPAWPVDGLALCTVGFCGRPVIVTDDAGGAIVTWEDSRADPYHYVNDIYAQRVLSTGVVDPAWPLDGRLLCSAAGVQYSPDMVADGAGGAIIAWLDIRTLSSQDLYAQHILSTGVVDPAWPVDGRVLSSNVSGPSVATDGAGGAIVTWSQGFSYNHVDIYAQHLRATGDVDPAWPVGGSALSTVAGVKNSPSIVTDAAGGAIVSWSDNRDSNPETNDNPDIYAQHVLSTGAVDPAWPVDGRALCRAPLAQGFNFRPTMIADGAGGAIVTWQDERTSIPDAYDNSDIYVQHVLSTGDVDPAWPVDGRALCTAAHTQYVPYIASDGAGGAIVTWWDLRGGVFDESDIYAQRVLASGEIPASEAPMTLTLPGTLNLRSLGRWVTAYLEPLGDFDASAIDVGSIRLHGNVSGASPVAVDPAAPSAIGDQDKDGIPDLMVKFERAVVELTLSAGTAVPVTVTGTVAGQAFSGSSTLKVLRAQITSPAAGAVLNAGTVMPVRWQSPPGANVHSVALLVSSDDGASWTLVAAGVANSGSYDWTVSSTGTQHARIAIVLVESEDASGYEVEGVLGMSERFTIQSPVGVGDGPATLALRGVSPNPGRGALQVHFSLADRQAARIEVLDVTGRRVMAREVGVFGPGQHHLELHHGLRAGIYVVRLTQGDQVRSMRAVVLD